MSNLWRSGVVLSVAGLVGGVGNYAFQGVMGRFLERSEFGYFNSTLGLTTLLGLPVMIASTSLVHYIAHFRAVNDPARLEGLISGCRKILFRLTILGSLIALVLVKPVSDFFHFPRTSLIVSALVVILVGLWSAYVNALCQGMSWFYRLAIIGATGVVFRLLFGCLLAWKFPVAEVGVLATAAAALASLAMLMWRKELPRTTVTVSPWNRELGSYLAVGAASMGGGWCFSQGDLLVAQRTFSGLDLGNYSAAGQLARALPMVVAPILMVLFTSRSGHRTTSALREQFLLLGLYAVGLAAGAVGLLVFRNVWVKLIFGSYTPEAAAMIGRLATTMVFVGLLQALGMWALASRWFKLALLYGLAGVGYWLVLLNFGTSPRSLLHLMPIAAAGAFGIVFFPWLFSMRTSLAANPAKHDI